MNEYTPKTEILATSLHPTNSVKAAEGISNLSNRQIDLTRLRDVVCVCFFSATEVTTNPLSTSSSSREFTRDYFRQQTPSFRCFLPLRPAYTATDPPIRLTCPPANREGERAVTAPYIYREWAANKCACGCVDAILYI